MIDNTVHIDLRSNNKVNAHHYHNMLRTRVLGLYLEYPNSYMNKIDALSEWIALEEIADELKIVSIVANTRDDILNLISQNNNNDTYWLEREEIYFRDILKRKFYVRDIIESFSDYFKLDLSLICTAVSQKYITSRGSIKSYVFFTTRMSIAHIIEAIHGKYDALTFKTCLKLVEHEPTTEAFWREYEQMCKANIDPCEVEIGPFEFRD